MFGTPSAWRVPGYTELRELGSGASGRVVMARQDDTGRLVAIKYLSEELRSDMSFVARFRHEARMLETLDSPQVARLYQYVESGEGAAIVMELVDGAPLRALLRAQGPTGPEAALVVLKNALLGLGAAHTAGVVHRDFKPENMIVSDDGSSKLVDVGIAVRAGDGEFPPGTPAYMPPEQWEGDPVTPASDIYAATVVFFECLTGSRPFRSQHLASLAREHRSVSPPLEDVPPPLQSLIKRGMAKRPAERPASAEEFLQLLESIAVRAYGREWEERGLRRLAALAGLLALQFPRAEVLPDADTSITLADPADAEDADADRRSPLGRLSAKIVVGVGCAAVVGVVGALLVSGGDDPEVRARSAAILPAETTTLAAPSEEPSAETGEPEETEEAEETGDDPTPTPSPTPSAATRAATTAPATTRPLTRPTSSPTASRTRTPRANPTRRPTPRQTTTKPAPTRTRKPSATPESSTPEKIEVIRSQRPRSTPTTQQPTTIPTATVRPPRPRPEPSSPPSSDPSPPGDGGGGDNGASQSPGCTPACVTSVPLPSAALALGLVTSGAVPVTFALGRRTAGRHGKRP